jgi:hypothetical protein
MNTLIHNFLLLSIKMYLNYVKKLILKPALMLTLWNVKPEWSLRSMKTEIQTSMYCIKKNVCFIQIPLVIIKLCNTCLYDIIFNINTATTTTTTTTTTNITIIDEYFIQNK